MPSGERNLLADDLLGRLPRSPDVYPHKVDLASMAVLLVRLEAPAYRSASFLDDRVLGTAPEGAWLPIALAAEALRPAPDALPVHFIFHTGHVGSTLVSRLLDETGGMLSLREPLPLRSLADAHDLLGRSDSLLSEGQFDSILAMFMRLWGRGYRWTSGIVVKATSSAGRLATPILRRDQRSRAIYINVRAESYLATLLAGENSMIDLRGHGPERMRRLQSRVSIPLSPLHTLSIGELAAMSWLVESCTKRDAARDVATAVISVDFEELLSSISEGIGRILNHFGLPHDAAQLSGLSRSPVLTRYSKAPEHGYTPELRTRVLNESRRQNREEIRKGMEWLERMARSVDGIEEVMTDATI